MAVLKQWLSRIAGDSAGARLGLAGIAVAVPLALLFIALDAAEPVMAPVVDGPIGEPERSRIVSHLQSQGIRYTVEAGRVRVPLEQRATVLAALRVNELLPPETSRGFPSLVDGQKWFHSSDQNRQLYNLALQEELSKGVEAFPWVRSATVILSYPRNTGFAATHHGATASVNVVVREQPLDEKKVEAIAGLVSGAVAEMEPDDVVVVDAAAGRRWRVAPADTGVQNPKQSLEDAYRRKITDALAYIDRVIVAVDVEAGEAGAEVAGPVVEIGLRLKSSRPEEIWELPGAGLGTVLRLREAGEAGPRVKREHETPADSGGQAARVGVTVNVPRSFFVTQYRRRGGAASEPSDTELGPMVEEQLQRIRRQVEPLVGSREVGRLVVDVYPDGPPPVAVERDEAVEAQRIPGWIDDEVWNRVTMFGLVLLGLAVTLLVLRRVVRGVPLMKTESEPREVPAAEPMDSGAFAAFRAASGRSVIASLRGEHPQTVALVLSHLPVHQAAEVLEGLPEGDRVEVVQRMADIGPADPGVIEEVERALASRLHAGHNGAGGAEEVAELLKRLETDTGRSVLRSLEIEDPALSDRVRRLMFNFDDLALLDGRSLETLLRGVDTEDLALAMQASEESLAAAVMRRLPRSEGKRLKQRIKGLGPVRVADVEAARERIIDAVLRLEEQEEALSAGVAGR